MSTRNAIFACFALFFGVGHVYPESRIQQPIIEPDSIVELTEQYLAENREKVEWCDYTLEAISFWYFRGEWHLHYECSEKRPGYHFGITVTNETPPQFTYWPGR